MVVLNKKYNSLISVLVGFDEHVVSDEEYLLLKDNTDINDEKDFLKVCSVVLVTWLENFSVEKLNEAIDQVESLLIGDSTDIDKIFEGFDVVLDNEVEDKELFLFRVRRFLVDTINSKNKMVGFSVN